jgi:hypothetical protein
MSRNRSLDNPAYMMLAQVTRDLHRLNAEGKGESEEADALLEDVYPAWGKVTPAEADRLNGLSADLYMLTGEEIFAKAAPAERTREGLGPRLRAAWERRDWDEVLTLLRTGPDFLDPAQLAYLRGRCWAELGHHDVALLFYDFAARLKPNNVSYQVLALEELVQLGQLDQALRRASAFSSAEDAQLLQAG